MIASGSQPNSRRSWITSASAKPRIAWRSPCHLAARPRDLDQPRNDGECVVVRQELGGIRDAAIVGSSRDEVKPKALLVVR